MSDTINIEIPIPTDNDGYVLLRCQRCGNFFKVIPSDYKDDGVLNLYCPCCGLTSETYVTEDVLDLSQSIVHNIATDIVYDEFKKMERMFRSGPIKFSAGERPKHEAENPIKSGIDALTVVDFECCKKTAKIKPLLKIMGSYCPFCGVKNMEINRTELKKIIYDFNCVSNRLIQADCDDYSRILKIFIEYIDSTELIHAYISDFGATDQDIENEFQQVASGYGRLIFNIGTNESQEVTTVYAVLKYIVDHHCNVAHGIGRAYSHASKFQDVTNEFTSRFVMVLIGHIERYLTKVENII